MSIKYSPGAPALVHVTAISEDGGVEDVLARQVRWQLTCMRDSIGGIRCSRAFSENLIGERHADCGRYPSPVDCLTIEPIFVEVEEAAAVESMCWRYLYGYVPAGPCRGGKISGRGEAAQGPMGREHVPRGRPQRTREHGYLLR